MWQRFRNGIPEYLARHYWWAYLWRPAAWFFDHQPVINLILFGQYKRLLQHTLQYLATRPQGALLQLTCVYGRLTPRVLETNPHADLFLADVAPLQLDICRQKLDQTRGRRLHLVRMNAESLAWRSDSFATILIFFLLHEMPADARHRTLNESLRVLQPSGRLIIAEYGPLPEHHWIYRCTPLRWLLLRLEPFLDGFWREDLTALLHDAARTQGKSLHRLSNADCFHGFYRVVSYQLAPGKNTGYNPERTILRQ